MGGTYSAARTCFSVENWPIFCFQLLCSHRVVVALSKYYHGVKQARCGDDIVILRGRVGRFGGDRAWPISWRDYGRFFMIGQFW